MATVASPRSISDLARPIGGNRIFNTFTDEESLQAIIRDIQAAKSKVQFESFLFNGEHGQRMTDALVAARKRGLAVQVLLDGKHTQTSGAGLIQQLKDAGVDVRFYNTALLQHSRYAVEHAKVTVIDDKRAWVGGANYDTEVNRDMMTRIEGPAVPRVQQTFNQGWAHAGGTVLPIKATPRPVGDVYVGVSQTAPGEQTARDQVLNELKTLGKGDKADVWMMDIGDQPVFDEVLKAKARGAEFRVLMDGQVPFLQGRPIDKWIQRLFGGAPDIYNVKRLQKADIPVKSYVTPEGITKLHSKVWVFTHAAGTPQQTRRVLGGSVNALKSAYEFNHEVGFLMYGPKVGDDIEKQISEDWTQHAATVPKIGFWREFKVQFIKVLTGHLI